MREQLMHFEPENPAVVEAGQGVRLSFHMSKAGFMEFTLTAACDGDWRFEGRESVMLKVLLNGEYNQDIILFYGDRWLEYPRLLGFLEAGSYEAELLFHEQSSTDARMASVKTVFVNLVDRDSELGLVYRYTPLLYGRNIGHPIESRYTDTPLIMFYTLECGDEQTVLEYQVIYSHEDEGTPAPMLMSKWGRLTDIEWTLRVELDRDGRMITATYQGPHHITTEFRGGYALGGHPVMQAATTNGMVTDVPTSSYRLLLAPVYHWNPAAEPRERVMDAFPFTYQMMAWETERHNRLSELMTAGSGSETWQVTDLRHYLYVQTSKRASDPTLQKATCIDIRVKLKGSMTVYSSSFGDIRIGKFRAVYEGLYEWFSTTVKLPEGTTMNDIEVIEAGLLTGGDQALTVSGLKAFMLTEHHLPCPAIQTQAAILLTTNEPVGQLWKVLL